MGIAAAGITSRVKKGELVTIKQISAETGIPEQTIRAWVALGYVERVRISSRRILVNRKQVMDCAAIYRPRPGARKENT